MTEKIYQYCEGRTSIGDELWRAVTESGAIVAEHISSSRWWGIRDTGPEGFYAAKYPDDYELIVLNDGEYP